MKLLMSRYSYLHNVLDYLAFEFGFKGNLTYHFLNYLGIKATVYPSRLKISPQEMKKLVNLALECYHDPVYFTKVLGL